MRTLALLGAAAGLLPSTARANVVGGDLQNFNAVPGGIDYVTVEASETLEPGYLNLGLMVNHAVNSLPYYEDSGQNITNYNDALTMMDFGVGFGVVDNVEVGFAVQDLMAQTADNSGAHGEFSGPGITNYRVYGKYRLLDSANGVGLAMIGTVDFNNVVNNPLVGDGGSPVGIGEVAVDTKIHGIAMALNAGYRFRHKGAPIPGMQLQPLGNQYIASAGLSYLLPWVDTKLIGEVYGARPAQPTASDIEARQSSSAEALLGLKYDATRAIALHAGGGTELIKGSATPDWRLYAGLDWAIGPVYRKEPPREVFERPLRPTAVPTEERAILHNIHFATNSNEIPDEAAAELTNLLSQIKTSPYDKIVVEGHTDSVGSAERNQQLSERRAGAVRQWLIDHGVPPAKVEAIGYGQTRPIADNGNFQGRQRNRRVEVLVIRSGTVLQKTQEGPAGPPKEGEASGAPKADEAVGLPGTTVPDVPPAP